MAASITFQSRNRGSFGFKGNFWYQLAIRASSFQSRNRGSFGFKLMDLRLPFPLNASFNLVIEVLLVSSIISQTIYILIVSRFNLVIEVLLVSRA